VAKNEQNLKFCHVFLMKKPSHADEVRGIMRIVSVCTVYLCMD
jgi:hypothetical protein